MHNSKMNRHLASLSSMLSNRSGELHNEPSVVWSTAHIPGLPYTGRPYDRKSGRRKLYVGSIALGFTLAMHCRIPGKALSDETTLYLFFLCLFVGVLANPMRHFEVYTGQWSINGPGRAFRIVPMLDGIGIAICLYSIFRAICCCCIASITAMYFIYSIPDGRLPFTYCRDFNLVTFEPEIYKTHSQMPANVSRTRVELKLHFENYPFIELRSSEQQYCNKSFGNSSTLYHVPAFNFFYIEVMQMRPDAPPINIKILITCIIIWIIIWTRMFTERILKEKLNWNTTNSHVLIVPSIWLMLILCITFYHLWSGAVAVMSKTTHASNKDMISILANAMIVSMYIHSAGTGTELIYGKGLNILANGHIDPLLNSENLVHSFAVLIFAVCHIGGAAVCNMLDYPLNDEIDTYSQSVLWMIPLYSRCSLVGQHSHFIASLLFLGLTFSYTVVAYALLKSSLHAIYEYRVKLVYVDQLVVAAVIIFSALLSVIFSTKYGLYLLETTDEILTGLAMPFICLLELVALLYLYRRSDFIDDMIQATLDNTCSTRISAQWKILPILVIVCIILKMSTFLNLDYHLNYFLLGLIPFIVILFAVPMKTCCNAYKFMRQSNK